MRACIGDASPTIFPRISRMKHSIRMNEILKSHLSVKLICVCSCVVKLSRMRTINFVPLTTHPQHFFSYMYKLIQLHAPKIQVEGCDVDEILDPLKKCIHSKKALKAAAVTKIFCLFSLSQHIYKKIFRKLIFYSLFLDVCVSIITMWM